MYRVYELAFVPVIFIIWRCFKFVVTLSRSVETNYLVKLPIRQERTKHILDIRQVDD